MWRDRRRTESLFLAALAIAAVNYIRLPFEPRALLLMESAIVLAGVLLVIGLKSWRGSQPAKSYTPYLESALICAAPIVRYVVGNIIGQPVANEMEMLSLFGCVALALAIVPQERKYVSLSLVASGFLALFSTSISDRPGSIVFAVIWLAGCVWHLVANHWERLELCSAQSVGRITTVRPLSVVLTITLFLLGGWFAKNRFASPNPFDFGIMPTSGGSDRSDPSARDGVGSGDMVIAATHNPQSFGAVDTDVFLESTESTLFDMFNDAVGEPKKKNKVERRQAVNTDKFIESHQKMSSSEKGGNSFSVDRRAPTKLTKKLEDRPENAAIQWIGPTGIRLGLERFDFYDGSEWQQNGDFQIRKLGKLTTNEQAWFFTSDSFTRLQDGEKASGAVKTIRLQSNRLPAPMLTAAVHIKDIDRADFFGIAPDGSWWMPGREKIPPLTVVHFTSTTITEDELVGLTNASAANVATKKKASSKSSFQVLSPTTQDRIDTLLQTWVDKNASPYQQLLSIVERFRTEFTFDRSFAPEGDDPIGQFLEQRRGGDHLFATATCLFAERIGLQARLATGFYVRPTAMDLVANHTNVLPEDIHVWPEIYLDGDRWFEVEPTPSFAPPIYQPSLWLMTRRFATSYWPHAAAILCFIGLAYWSRMLWISAMLNGLWLLSAPFSPRRRMVLAVWIVERRFQLLGRKRPVGRPPRDWLLGLAESAPASMGLTRLTAQFLDLADRFCFGVSSATNSKQEDVRTINQFVNTMQVRLLKQLSGDYAK